MAELQIQTPLQNRQPEALASSVKSAEAVAVGSFVQGLAGASATVLAILGLCGISLHYMSTIGIIVCGAGLIFGGGVISGRYRRTAEATAHTRGEKVEFAGGLTAEILGGLAGVTLGILALVFIAPATLSAISIIVFGAAIFIGSGATYRLNQFHFAKHEEAVDRFKREAVTAASGAEFLVGLAGIALGLLALIGYYPMTLILVGVLCIAVAMLIGGAALGGRMVALLER